MFWLAPLERRYGGSPSQIWCTPCTYQHATATLALTAKRNCTAEHVDKDGMPSEFWTPHVHQGLPGSETLGR